MKLMIAAALVAAAVTAAAAQQASSPGQPAPSTAPQTASQPPGQITPGIWDVEQVRCSTLLNAADDDRASAAMFYYGYLAAQAGIQVIDVNRIADNIAKVMAQCAAAPSMTVPRAFGAALAARK